MNGDPATLTLTAVLSGAAIPFVALIVQQLVDYIKALLDPRPVNGIVVTAIVTLGIYLFAYAFAGDHTAEGFFAAFLVWLGAAMATVGTHRALISAGVKS